MFSASLPTEEHGRDLIRALFIIGSEVGIARDRTVVFAVRGFTSRMKVPRGPISGCGSRI